MTQPPSHTVHVKGAGGTLVGENAVPMRRDRWNDERGEASLASHNHNESPETTPDADTEEGTPQAQGSSGPSVAPADEEEGAHDPQQTDEAATDDVAAMAAEIESLKDQHLRLRAEFENYRRRTLQEAEQIRKNAASALVEQLLPVVDNLERALQSAESDPHAQSYVQGTQLILKQFMGVLEQAGLQPVPGVGEAFDPAYHEAVAAEACEQTPPGHIIEELQRGYTLNGKLLRVGMVKVAAE